MKLNLYLTLIPNWQGVEGLLRSYKEKLETVEMAEPTNFSEVLNCLPQRNNICT